MSDPLRIINGRVYDPTNGIDGEVREICIQGGKVGVKLPVDEQEVGGKALPFEATLLHQGQGAVVLGLNVGLQAMQTQGVEGVILHQLEPFTHEALTGERRAGIVSE